MERWQKFELECTEYLNETYGKYFTHLGFSDSSVSDIKYEKDGNIFFIEAKMPNAQSGQFVLLPDLKHKKFVFSNRNKSEKDENVKLIIEYINKNFFRYVNAGTKGIEINLPQKVFSDWIINTYKNKSVEFIITKGKEYIIFPIEKYGEYFKIYCKFRAKKSGSRSVPKRLQKEVVLMLKNMNFEFRVLDSFLIESHIDLDNKRFSIDDSDFLIRRYGADNIYRIRRLSNTVNSNVIFSIELVKEQDYNDLEIFRENI